MCVCMGWDEDGNDVEMGMGVRTSMILSWGTFRMVPEGGCGKMEMKR